MKKIYILAGAILATLSLNAQVTVDFENHELSPNSYYDFSDGEGGFTSSNVFLNSNYNPEWGGFLESGFALSNKTDVTTPDYTNPYSAITGIGADESSNYVINFDGDTLFFLDELVQPLSVEITNTTFAYFTIKNGNEFGKIFGENGDKDYFYIKIKAHSQTGAAVDSVLFYLADFRSDNEEDHYIIDTWTQVDLSEMAEAKYLTFEYFSSDIGDFGSNTPAYFAMDNLVYQPYVTGLNKEAIPAFKLFPNPTAHTIHIEGSAGDFAIFDVQGIQVAQFYNKGTSQVDVSGLNSGLYFVKNLTTTATQKLIIQ